MKIIEKPNADTGEEPSKSKNLYWEIESKTSYVSYSI